MLLFQFSVRLLASGLDRQWRTDRDKGWYNGEKETGHIREKTRGSYISSPFFSSLQCNVRYWHACKQYHQSNQMKECVNIKSLSALGCVSLFVSVPF